MIATPGMTVIAGLTRTFDSGDDYTATVEWVESTELRRTCVSLFFRTALHRETRCLEALYRYDSIENNPEMCGEDVDCRPCPSTWPAVREARDRV